MDDNKRLLVVEDEEDLNEILKFNLESEGYEVDTAFSAEEALRKDLSIYHLMILDVMMGKMSGFNLANKIRRELKLPVPFIFLTARTTENDLLTGFNIGADDYISKPFSIRELQARVKAVLKRVHVPVPEPVSKIVMAENIILDTNSKRLFIEKRVVDLTRKEFEILALLGKTPGKIYSREEILDRVWENSVIVNDRTVDVTITRLRRKMEEFGYCLHNKAGYGYFFEY